MGPSGRSDGDGQLLQGAAAREQQDQRTGPEAIERSVGSHSGAAEVRSGAVGFNINEPHISILSKFRGLATPGPCTCSASGLPQ